MKETDSAWEKDYIYHIDKGSQNITINKSKIWSKERKEKRLEKSKDSQSIIYREQLLQKYLCSSIFLVHLGDDNGGGIKKVWSKEPPSGR